MSDKASSYLFYVLRFLGVQVARCCGRVSAAARVGGYKVDGVRRLARPPVSLTAYNKDRPSAEKTTSVATVMGSSKSSETTVCVLFYVFDVVGRPLNPTVYV